MITADLHLHTCYSHGKATPFEMHCAAKAKGIAITGFSEHSPRPESYTYINEYREQLKRHLPDYVNQVRAIQAIFSDQNCLLGMEMDWFDQEPEFVAQAARAYDFDYLIGSVHFIDNFGFDDSAEPWSDFSQTEREKLYEQYFRAWKNMLASGLFQIAAHPDLIKIFSAGSFHKWLQKPDAQTQVRDCLATLRDSGMAMEVSSAGLRKPCQEIYPCPEIMEIAAQLDVPIAFASDAHAVQDVGHAFTELASYAARHGYKTHCVFKRGTKQVMPFI